jgi:hypothetical protein
MEHNAKLSMNRRVKKADLEAGFFFINFLGVRLRIFAPGRDFWLHAVDLTFGSVCPF